MISPIEAVTQPDPYPYYATLVEQRPMYRDDHVRMWVASDAGSVTAALSAPALRVRPPAEPVPAGITGTAAGDVFGQLVRMTDGDVSVRLKRLIVAALSVVRPERTAALAAERTAQAMKSPGGVSLPELMFSVPAQVVATLCGLDDGASEQASRLIGDFVQCIPAAATADQQAAAATAAAALLDLLGPRLDERADGLLGELVRAASRDNWSQTAPLVANGIGLLSQTYDATAGLIGNTLLALARHGQPDPTELEAFVREVVRHDAPVQNTRRFAADEVRIGDASIQPGEAVLVVLAAANRDPAVNPDPAAFRADRTEPAVFTFGAGAHRCPGESVAVAITTGVVGTLLGQAFELGSLPEAVTYRPLANARIPVL